jgi:hypothetical protein
VIRYGDLQIHSVGCLKLFWLGRTSVLLMSPQQPCKDFVGDLDLSGRRFIADTHGVLDAGNAWNGAVVVPRILSIDADGFLRQLEAPEFDALRGAPVSRSAFDVPPGAALRLDDISGDCCELAADLLPGNTSELGFDFRCGADGRPGVSVRIARPGTLIVGAARASVSRGLDRCRLRIWMGSATSSVAAARGPGRRRAPARRTSTIVR